MPTFLIGILLFVLTALVAPWLLNPIFWYWDWCETKKRQMAKARRERRAP